MRGCRSRPSTLIPHPFPWLAVDQQDVLPAVVIVVDKGAAGAHGLGHVLVPLRAIDVVEADPGSSGDVREVYRRACPLLRSPRRPIPDPAPGRGEAEERDEG